MWIDDARLRCAWHVDVIRGQLVIVEDAVSVIVGLTSISKPFGVCVFLFAIELKEAVVEWVACPISVSVDIGCIVRTGGANVSKAVLIAVEPLWVRVVGAEIAGIT